MGPEKGSMNWASKESGRCRVLTSAFSLFKGIAGLFFFLTLGCTPGLRGGNSSLPSDSAPIPESPGPFQITLNVAGDREVYLQWSNSQNASTYSIFYRESGHPEFTLASANATSPYLLTGLSNSVTYEFKIVAINSRGRLESQTFILTPLSDPEVVATKLVFATQPETASPRSAGSQLYVQPSIQFKNSANVLASSDSSPVTLALYTDSTCTTPAPPTPSGARSLSGTLTKNASLGVATFNDLSVNLARSSLYLKATSGSLHSACSNAFQVLSGIASPSLSTLSLSSSTVTAGNSVVATLGVVDDFGNAAPSGVLPILFSLDSLTHPGSWSAVSSTASDTYSAELTQSEPGTYTVSVSVAGVPISQVRTLTVLAAGLNHPPVAQAFSANYSANATTIITLPYTDADGDSATHCTILSNANLSNVTINSACSCTSGVCSVVVNGSSNTSSGGFDFHFGSPTSSPTPPVAHATLTRTNASPTVSNFSFGTLISTSGTTTIGIPYADIDGDHATACSVSNLSANASIQSPCSCSAGVCSVGLLGNSTAPTGTFSFSVTTFGGLTSNTATVEYSIDGQSTIVTSPQVRDYGSILVGQSSSTFDIKISNTGAASATGCSAPYLSPATTHFSITSNSCTNATLAPGSTCTVRIVASPKTTGSLSTTLYQRCNSRGTESRTAVGGITVTGATSAPQLTTYADQGLDFGRVRVGSTSSTLEIAFTNSGFDSTSGCQAPLISQGSSDFSIVEDGCGKTNLPPSGVCTVTLKANPTLTGTVSGTLSRSCTEGGSASVSLSAAGWESSSTPSLLSYGLGTNHSCVVMSDGKVRCWGDNGYGNLGDGTLVDKLTPVEVSSITTATAVASASQFSCALLSDSTVKCWGLNTSGQVGTEVSGSVNKTPVQVSTASGTLTNVALISAGTAHACAVLTDGSVWCWGQTTVNGTSSISSQAQKISGISTAKTTAGALTSGTGFSCVVLTDGTARCWGNNSAYRQLGNNSTSSSTAAVTVLNLSGAFGISASSASVCALLTSGQVKCWGMNVSGQLGDGTTTTRTAPVLVTGITSATSIASSSMGKSFCANLSDQTVKCWGENTYGKLGDGTNANRSTPVQVLGLSGVVQISLGDQSACARTSDAKIKCWGKNNIGQLGGGSAPAQMIPKNGDILSTLGPVRSISSNSANSSAACALLTSGSIKCWGENGYLLLGNGGSTTTHSHITPVSVSGISTATQISMGFSHACSLLADGTIRCWGLGTQGELGTMTAANSSTPAVVYGITNAIQVVTGANFSCALLSKGSVQCWGDGSNGELGIISCSAGCTVAYPFSVDSLTTVTSISAGSNHVCALTSDQRVYCWGQNNHGQLGNGTITQANTPTLVPGLLNVIAISAGSSFTCALLADNTVKCWGYGGKLGNNSAVGSTVPVSVLSYRDGNAPLGQITAIASNYDGTCGLRSTSTGNQVVCWGYNGYGTLGIGSLSITRRMAYDVPGLQDISSLSQIGGHTTCATTSSGTPYCFGQNTYNQTGTNGMAITPVSGF